MCSLQFPNGDLIASNEARGLLLDMPPNHVSRWQPEAFNRWLAGFGFRLEACQHECCVFAGKCSGRSLTAM